MKFKPKAAAGLLAFAVAAGGVTLAAATPAEAAVTANQTSVSATPHVKKADHKKKASHKKKKRAKASKLIVRKSCTVGNKKVFVKATIVGKKPRAHFINGCEFKVYGGKIVKLDRDVTVAKHKHKIKKDVTAKGPALVTPDKPKYTGDLKGNPLVAPDKPKYTGDLNGNPLWRTNKPHFDVWNPWNTWNPWNPWNLFGWDVTAKGPVHVTQDKPKYAGDMKGNPIT